MKGAQASSFTRPQNQIKTKHNNRTKNVSSGKIKQSKSEP